MITATYMGSTIQTRTAGCASCNKSAQVRTAYRATMPVLFPNGRRHTFAVGQTITINAHEKAYLEALNKSLKHNAFIFK